MALRKAAEMALEVMEYNRANGTPNMGAAIEALRQALAQPEQRGHCTCGDPEALGVVHFRTRPCFHYTEPLAQPEQEPVAIVNEGMGGIEWLSKPLPEDTPLYAAPVYAVNMSQERVDETGKCEYEHINDRERLEAIVNVICRYLPPGGTDIKSAMSEIIALVDPLPPKREWVGLTDEEVESWKGNYDFFDSALVREVEAKLKEKNDG